MAHQHGENLKQAMDTLRTHKMRSALTVFGVVLGVSVIMLVAALITGFDAQIQENIKQFGADTAFITRFDQGPSGARRPKEERERKPLTLADSQALLDSCSAVRNVTTWTTWWEVPHSVRTKAGTVTAIDFRGVQANFGIVYANAATVAGRFISEASLGQHGLARNCVPIVACRYNATREFRSSIAFSNQSAARSTWPWQVWNRAMLNDAP